jgi:hypothetical protein
MIGRSFRGRATSSNPASRKALAMPVIAVSEYTAAADYTVAEGYPIEPRDGRRAPRAPPFVPSTSSKSFHVSLDSSRTVSAVVISSSQ